MRAQVLVIAILSGSALLAWQPDTPSPESTTEQAQEDQSQPDSNPVALAEDQPDNEQESPNEDPPGEPADPQRGWLTVSAIIQALVAIAILGFTGGLYFLSRGALQATRDAANAAGESAKTAEASLKLAYRPHLDIKDIGHNSSPAVLTDEPVELKLSFKLFNPGTTPVGVTSVVWEYSIGDEGGNEYQNAGEVTLISPTKGFVYDVPIGTLSEKSRSLFLEKRLVVRLRVTVEFDGPLESRSMTFRRRVRCGPNYCQSALDNWSASDDGQSESEDQPYPRRTGLSPPS